MTYTIVGLFFALLMIETYLFMLSISNYEPDLLKTKAKKSVYIEYMTHFMMYVILWVYSSTLIHIANDATWNTEIIKILTTTNTLLSYLLMGGILLSFLYVIYEYIQRW